MPVLTSYFKFGTIILLLTFLVPSGFAQDKLKEKLNKIKGDVNKITITANGEEFSFKGKDAQKLFKRLNAGTNNLNTFTIKTDYDSLDKHIIKINSDDCDGKIFKIKIKDSDSDIWIGKNSDVHGFHKKIKVEVDDGNKKVTVTTKENGDEKTDVYEGDEADKILEELKSEHGHDWMISIDKDGDKENRKNITIEMEEESSEEE